MLTRGGSVPSRACEEMVYKNYETALGTFWPPIPASEFPEVFSNARGPEPTSYPSDWTWSPVRIHAKRRKPPRKEGSIALMADLLVLAVHLPGIDGSICGEFILFSTADRGCEIAFRSDWEKLVGQDDAEVLNEMEATLRDMAEGADTVESFIAALEDRLSNTVRCLDRLRLPTTLSVREHATLLRAALLPGVLAPTASVHIPTG